MKIKCPFWPICGPAPIHQRLARRAFPCGDGRRDYIATVCNNKDKYLSCEYYKIRAKPKPKEVEKMKLGDILENFNNWLKHKKPSIITGLMWAGVGVAGFLYIIYHEIKDPYEKRMKK